MSNNTTQYDTVGGIMRFEAGEMDIDEASEFFQHLVDTGTLRHLQGHYQRTAQRMAEDGWITLK